MCRYRCPCVLALALSSTFVESVVAEVQIVRHYRLGDDDPNAKIGDPARAHTIDFGSDAIDAEKIGISNYGKVPLPEGVPDAGLAVEFKNVDSRYEAPAALTGVTNNMGIQAYIMPSSLATTPDGRPFFNGDHAFPLDEHERGYGLVILNGFYHAQLSYPAPVNDVLLSTNVPATRDVPVAAALVFNQGQVEVYINRVLRATSSDVPIPPSAAANDMLSIGNFWHGGPDVAFAGMVDEAQVFTFQPGEFDPQTDLLTVPEPTGVEVIAIAMAFLVRAIRRQQFAPSARPVHAN